MINSKILALKYRPQEFKDLIGQNVISQTITNAIKLNKTPNAYLLTGIRGVGKTTTARLIAKALNCKKNENKSNNCSIEKPCHSCNDIINSNHIDILEMDAASKTGIDDVRELIENAKYSPTSAQYKIFIIDEIHMLSKQAFNGLLKTLEEPPPRLKFILATTEVRKIPVTILSRCQRFDLKRVNLDEMLNHLKNICQKEKGKISDNALRLIAKASEGSVRDAVSLLDRALIFQNINNNEEIKSQDIRNMLGLADKSKIITLLKEILSGDQKKSILILKDLISQGLDAKNFLNDILEIIYLLSRRVSLGPIDRDMTISEAETQLIDEYSKNLNMEDLGLFWQLTIKTLDDLKIVSSEDLALEMYVMQLLHLKKIESSREENNDQDSNLSLEMEKIQINEITSNELNEKKTTSIIKKQLKNTEQVQENYIKRPELNKKHKFVIKNFQDLIEASSKEKEIELKYDLERNVKLVNFSQGKINISFNDKLNKKFIKTLTEKLLDWTGERWIISLTKENGEKSIYEKNMEQKKQNISKELKSETNKKIISTFSDAKLKEVKEVDDA